VLDCGCPILLIDGYDHAFDGIALLVFRRLVAPTARARNKRKRDYDGNKNCSSTHDDDSVG
jgi:hypothetical protein